jgi:hypothetical protein
MATVDSDAGRFFDLGQWNTLDVIRKLGTPY